MLPFAAFLVFALLIPGHRACADELTDSDFLQREARLTSLQEIRRSIRQNTPPRSLTVKPGEEEQASDNALEFLRKRTAELQVPIDRLGVLRASYPELADLATIDGERNEIRRALREGEGQFSAQIELIESTKKIRMAKQLEAILSAQAGKGKLEHVGAVMRIDKEGEDVCNFKLKLRDAMMQDEEAYDHRKRAINESRARRKAARLALTAGGGALVMLGGISLWVFRRERRPAGPAGPGSVIGKSYRLERELGRGGMGLVFEATDLTLQRKVAIKQLRAELKQNPKDLEMFLAEARLVASLKHPHVVEIYAIVNEGSDLHLVFELVPGRPLHIALQSVGRLTLDSARSLMRQVGSALDFAHANKVIHGDLKPGNIMVTPQGAAKVMDFGLAHRASMTVARVTKAGAWGTPPYMAPEQEMGTTSRESDLYSMGVMFYETVTGKLPFPGPNYLAQKRELHVALPSQAVPGLPKRLDDILLRALQPDPKLRFHSAAEFVQALV